MMSRAFLCCLVFATVAGASASSAAERHVPGDHATIQAALDASAEGDVVIVAPGRYYETLRFPEVAIHLKSSSGPALTIIDGDQIDTVVIFEGEPGRGSILEGFTLTNGRGTLQQPAGGVYLGPGASAVIRGNVIRHNFGLGSGNGIHLNGPESPLIEGNDIHHNLRTGGSGGSGGGISLHGSLCVATDPDCGAVIRDNYIGNNRASSGGGIDLNGTRAEVIGNAIEFNRSQSHGGGISISNGSLVLIENNLIRANTASNGGGGVSSSVPTDQRGPRVINNTFIDNDAPLGSAIQSNGFDADALYSNNLVVAPGPGTALDCSMFSDPLPPRVSHNLVSAPAGTPFGGACAGLGDIEGNSSQTPQFEGEFDFRLRDGSAGIDAGDDALPSQDIDLHGRPRRMDGDGDGNVAVDVGAYETSLGPLFADGFESGL